MYNILFTNSWTESGYRGRSQSGTKQTFSAILSALLGYFLWLNLQQKRNAFSEKFEFLWPRWKKWKFQSITCSISESAIWWPTLLPRCFCCYLANLHIYRNRYIFCKCKCKKKKKNLPLLMWTENIISRNTAKVVFVYCYAQQKWI